jgi:hypothetical protein
MPNFKITANIDYPQGLDAAAFARGAADMVALRSLIATLNGVAGNGVGSQSVYIQWNDAVAVGNDAIAGVSAGVISINTGPGAVGATIANTLVTATWTTSDTVSAGLVAAAIRANTTVNQYVTATNSLMQLTLASVVAGTQITVCGITFTAVANAAAIRQFGQFNIDGTDTQDAQALALAINRHPSLSATCRAVANTSTGVVYIGLLDNRTATARERLGNPNAVSTVTFQAAIPTAVGFCMVLSLDTGVSQNEIRCVPSGTGTTFITNNATANILGGATGGGRVTQRLVGAP